MMTTQQKWAATTTPFTTKIPGKSQRVETILRDKSEMSATEVTFEKGLSTLVA
jgi:hypothetical protein